MLPPEPSVGFVQHPPGDAHFLWHISVPSFLPSTQLPLILTDFAHSRGFCHSKSLCHFRDLTFSTKGALQIPACFLECGFSALPSLDITQLELVNVMGQSPQHMACLSTVPKVRSFSSVLHLFHDWNAGTHLLLLSSNCFGTMWAVLQPSGRGNSSKCHEVFKCTSEWNRMCVLIMPLVCKVHLIL